MRRILTLFFALVMGMVVAMATTQTEVAMALTQRLSPRLAQKVTYRQLPADTCDYFTLTNEGDRVVIGGNNANAMAVGLNHYLKNWNHPNGEGWTAICRTIYDFVK